MDGQMDSRTEPITQLVTRGFETETKDMFTHSEVTKDKIDNQHHLINFSGFFLLFLAVY